MKIYKRAGNWHLDVSIAGTRYREALGTSDHRAAKAIAADRVAAIKQGKGASRMGRAFARMLFAEAADLYLEERKPSVSERTYQLEAQRLRPLRSFFENRPLFRIKGTDIAAYQKLRRSTIPPGRPVPVSGRTINMEVGVLRRLMKRGSCWSAVAEDVRMDRENVGEVAKVLSEDEKRLLFATATSKPGWIVAHYAAVLAATTTCRGVELRNLRWQDVDFFAKSITIHRSKTHAGRRTIPLASDALAALARLRERAETSAATEPEHYVFPACESQKLDPTRPQRSWRTAWRNLIRETARTAGAAAAREAIESGKGWKAGLHAWRKASASFKGFRFHDLRHQAITELAEAGAADAVLMAMAGHLSRRMMEHYSHTRMEAKRAAIATLDRGGRLMGSRLGVEGLGPKGQVN